MQSQATERCRVAGPADRPTGAGSRSDTTQAFGWQIVLVTLVLVGLASTCLRTPGQSFRVQTPAVVAGSFDTSTPVLASEPVTLQNDLLEVIVVPEMRGRITQVIDKRTGQDQLYATQALTPTETGTDQATHGMIWCLPGTDHGYIWDEAWTWSVITSTSGTTVTMVASESQDKLRVSVDLHLPTDRGHLVVQPRLENPGPTAAEFTVATYTAPTKAKSIGSLLHQTAIPPTFAYGQAFSSVYDQHKDKGFVRVAAPEAPAAHRGFAGGWDPAWMCGAAEGGTGAQTSLEIQAGGTVAWREFWYPVHDLGNVIAATDDAAIGATYRKGQWRIAVQPTHARAGEARRLSVWHAATCTELAEWPVIIDDPYSTFHDSLAGASFMRGTDAEVLAITYVDSQADILASHGPADCATLAMPEPHLGYGVNVRHKSRIDDLLPDLGFEWVKLWEEYPESRLPLPEPTPYRILYNINCGAYVNDMAGWRNHLRTTVQMGLGDVEAYEICNESNVRNANWGGHTPDPVKFAQMLCVAYEEIKEIDPAAWVISGGLAPVGRIASSACGPGNNCDAMDEWTYLEGMLDSGAGACMDAFGYHPYGFAYAPEKDPDSVQNAFAFRGVEKLRAILVTRGWADMPIWATEFNWIRRPSDDGYEFNCSNNADYRTFLWQEVTAQTQADYLVRAFQYADTHWPWMQGMFMWNLDWHDYLTWLPCFHPRYYALRRHTESDIGAATPAYLALAEMEKRPASMPNEPVLVVEPSIQNLRSDFARPQVLAPSFQITNAGTDTFYWKVTRMPESTLPASLSSIWGLQGHPLTVTVNTAGLSAGIYTATLRIDTFPTTAQLAPQMINVVLNVGTSIYLPMVMRQPVAVPLPALPSLPAGPSKIGVHAIAEGGTLDFVRQVADGGAHVAVVKGVSSFAYLCEVKEISPPTITIGRWSDHRWEAIEPIGDPAIKARDYLDRHMVEWAHYRACVDYWEVLNEVNPSTIEGHVWLAEFHKAAMEIADTNGYKLALFSYSLGVPEMYHWRAMADTGVFAQAKAGGHILSLHEYGWPHMHDLWGEPLPQYPGQDPKDPSIPRYPDRGAVTGRYRHLYRDILIPRDEVIPLALTEVNLAMADPDERERYFLDEIAWYDDRLREDDYVIGMNIFTLGGFQHWENFDFVDFLPDLAERIIALRDE